MTLRIPGTLHRDLARLLQDSAVTFTLRTAAAVLVYVTQIVMARWMGAAELGHYVFALAWLWILGMAATLGLPAAAHRFIPAGEAAGDPGIAGHYLRWSRLVVLAAGAGIALFAAAVTWAADPGLSSATSRTLLVALPAVPLVALSTLYSETARAWLRFLFASMTGVFLRPALFLVAIAAAAWLGVAPSAVSAMLMLAALIVLILGLQHGWMRRRLAPPDPRAGAGLRRGAWLRVALPVLIADLYQAYFIDINLVVSGLFLEPADLAVYNAALRTVAIIAFGNAAVGLAVAPRAAKLYAQGDIAGLQLLARRALHLTFWPALLCVALLVAMGRPVLALFGEQFTAGYVPMLVVAVSQVVVAAAGPLLPLLKVTGHHDRCLVGSVVALLATVACNVVLVPRLGALGGALSVLFVTCGWMIWLYRLVVRHIGIAPSLRAQPLARAPQAGGG
jgi:O-antigen/teichoic acid export membrane protein